MNIFKAAVKYDDFTGSVAADVSDNIDPLSFLEQKGIVGPGNRLAGIRISSRNYSGADVDDVGLVCYIYGDGEFDPKPAKLRAVECNISLSKLLSFYKRFDLVMTRRGMNLHDTEVDGPHYD